MSEKKKVKINGFVFTDEAEAEQAKKEAHGIHYVEERADMHHPETVLEIYNKMVKQELFETAVGFTYLKELQEYLIQNPSINNSDIPEKIKDFCKKQGERKEGVKKNGWIPQKI